jgi:predicted HicB family RNase H-like nuclease
MKDARKIAPFGLRLPPELKEWLQQQALKNHRSLNAELLARLEQSKQLSN